MIKADNGHTFDVQDLLHKPHVDGGRGPDAYDCYGLAWEIYRRTGVELPVINIDEYSLTQVQETIETQSNRKEWVSIDMYQIPCVLRFLPVKAGDAQHLGVYIGQKTFIHSMYGFGVVISKMFEWKHKIIGMYQYASYLDSIK